MSEYFPLSPESKNAEEYNKNLPGLGGVFNNRMHTPENMQAWRKRKEKH